MKPARLARLLVSIAVAAMSLLATATASAAESSNPLFLPVNGQAVAGLGGPSRIKAREGQIITCQKNSAAGNITSSLLVGNFVVHYLECTVVENEDALTKCTIKSKNAAAEGLIVTNPLHGILGLNLSPAPLDTGILFLPASGKIFVELEEATNDGIKCAPATKVTGTVAAAITPVGVDTTKGLLVFPTESIKKIDLTHGLGLREPELIAYTVTARLQQVEVLAFSEPTGIT